jgi:cation diffusion facilitator family transporter
VKRFTSGIRAAQAGLFVNAALVVAKLAAGVAGHSYALVADAVESSTDIFASLIVWGGLHVSAQPADESHPYGHGKAEALATAAVALMLLGAAIGIAIAAVREIFSPHQSPAPFTLIVLAAVIIIKEVLLQRCDHLGRGLRRHRARHLWRTRLGCRRRLGRHRRRRDHRHQRRSLLAFCRERPDGPHPRAIATG